VLSRGGAPAPSGDTFLSLLFQDQMGSSDSAASAHSGGAGSAGNAAGTTQGTSAQKRISQLAIPISTETQTSSKRKKAAGDSGAAAPVFVARTIDTSAVARWLLLLTGGNASDASSSAPFGSGVEAELGARSTGQAAAADSPDPIDNARSDSAPLLAQPANSMGGADNAIRGVTIGTVDAAPIAELRLTPIGSPVATSRVATPVPTSSLPVTPALSTFVRPKTDPAAGAQSQGVTERTAAPEPRVDGSDTGGESSLDQSATSQRAALAVTKKKAETGYAQSDEPATTSEPGGGEQRAATSPIATPPPESQSTRATAATPAAASSVLEPASMEPANPSAPSVGTIELQVRGADEQQVGLRFVERQGRVEIQVKSGDVQTAQALSDSLAGLKTSLNENGWNVESRVQDRLSSAGQGSQPVASADQFGSPQTLRTEQISMGQTNRQSGSDSSAGNGHSGRDQDGSSGTDGQQPQSESAGSEPEGQGRRSARDTEAWLESIESNLSRSSSSRVTTGVTE
jgi:hypothetical protein